MAKHNRRVTTFPFLVARDQYGDFSMQSDPVLTRQLKQNYPEKIINVSWPLYCKQNRWPGQVLVLGNVM